MNLGVESRADDLIVPPVGGRALPGGDVETSDAFCVGDGEILPGGEGDPVQGAFQHPVPRTGGVSRLQNDIGDLEHL